MGATSEQAEVLRHEWQTDSRWTGIRRDYTAEDVLRLRGPVTHGHAHARRDARLLWEQLHGRDTAARPSVAALVAEAEAGSSAAAFDQMKSVIAAGAAGATFGDELPSGSFREGRVLVPTGEHIEKLTSARLAADVLNVPALVIARTTAQAAALLTSADDERDHEFLTGEPAPEGFCRVRPSLYACVRRGLAFAPYADVLSLETLTPDLAAARAFATVIHSQHPGKLLAYHCSTDVAKGFRQELAALGYRLQSTSEPGLPVPSAAAVTRRARTMALAGHR